MSDPETLPIRMPHDRLLASTEGEPGERKKQRGNLDSGDGSDRPPACVGRRSRRRRSCPFREVDDRVLFDPADRAEVEVRGKDYVLLRERDLHAVAAERLSDGKTGLYL